MNIRIEKNSQLPIYLQVVEFILEKIKTGEWEPQQQIPSEDELAEELKISRGTLRKAIGILAEEKVLVKVHGKGTFVSAIEEGIPLIEGIIDTPEKMNWFGLDLNSKVIAQKINNCQDQDLADKLGVQIDSKILHYQKLFYKDRKPFAVQDTYLQIEKVASMKNVSRLQGIEQVYANHKISICKPPKEIRVLLEIDHERKALRDSYIIFNEKREPIEYKVGWFIHNEVEK